MEEYTQSRCRAAENAALLLCLNELPTAPEENRLTANDTSNALSLHQEIRLVEAFAFLSSMKDDPNRVTAVCMEADPDEAGVTFRVAANTGCPPYIVQGLQAVADIMVQASRHDISRDVADQRLLEQITGMCSARILCRLRSKHATKTQKTVDKPRLPLLLAKTVSQCRLNGSVGALNSVPGLAKMYEQCTKLKNIFKRLEKCSDKHALLPHLRELLLLAHHFDVRALISLLSLSNTTDPTLQDYLPRAIEKLARYPAIAAGLANASRATKHSLFKRITVRSLEPPDLHLDNLTFTEALQDLDSLWSRFATGVPRSQSQQLFKKTKAKYRSRILSCRTKWKVHAEIQILCFYEQRPHQKLPRAICASKSACYLCNLFLKLHGKFVVPRTHGRIYHSWTLPPGSTLNLETIQSLLPVMRRFNRAVETTTRKALMGESGRHAPPNESVLAVDEPWSSHSTIMPRQSAPSNQFGEVTVPVTGPDDGHPLGQTIQCASTRTDTSSSSVSVLIQSDCGTYLRFLEQGQRIYKDIEQGDCISVQTSAIHLQFCWSSDFTGDATRSATGSGCYRINVEHLWGDSVTTSDTRIVDVDRIRCGDSEVVFADRSSGVGRIICRNGEHKVSLTFEKIRGNAVAQEI